MFVLQKCCQVPATEAAACSDSQTSQSCRKEMLITGLARQTASFVPPPKMASGLRSMLGLIFPQTLLNFEIHEINFASWSEVIGRRQKKEGFVLEPTAARDSHSRKSRPLNLTAMAAGRPCVNFMIIRNGWPPATAMKPPNIWSRVIPDHFSLFVAGLQQFWAELFCARPPGYLKALIYEKCRNQRGFFA